MSNIGSDGRSLRKKDSVTQKSIGVGFTKVMFAHKAVAGETSISFSALNTPSELSGFVQPTPGLLASLNVYQFRRNVTLISSLRGVLMDFLSYTVATNNLIRLNFEAEEGEIFTGFVDPAPRNNLLVVDGESIATTGDLAPGDVQFNVGVPFEINKYPSQQVGAIKVYRNGILQVRCEGNDLLNPGDYVEIPVPGGLGAVIEFKITPPGPGDDKIVVTSNGALFERPSGSMMANIENLGGQVDQIIQVLAAVSGQPTSFFQVAPNQVDLRQFGDQVFENTRDIAEIKNGDDRVFRVDTPNGHGAINTAIRFFTNVTQTAPFVTFGGNANLGSTFTINEPGVYFIKYRARRNVDGNLFVWGLSRNSNQLTTDVNAIAEADRLAGSVADGPNQLIYVSDTVWLNAGDVIRAHDTGLLANQPTENNANNSLSITQVVRG